jgi:hypothetical protein
LLERATDSGRDEVLPAGRFLLSGMRFGIIPSDGQCDQLDQSTSFTVTLKRAHGLRRRSEESKNRREKRRQEAGWRPVRQPDMDRRPPPRASRVRESENDKYKQRWITGCLYLSFSDSL